MMLNYSHCFRIRCRKERAYNKIGDRIGRLGVNSEMFKDDSENLIEYNKSSMLEENQDRMIEECLMKDDLMILKYFYSIRKKIMWEVVPLIAEQYFRSKNLHDQIKNICKDRVERSLYSMEVQ